MPSAVEFVKRSMENSQKKSSLDCMVTTVSVVLERKILERYMFNREELPQVGQELVSLKLT